MLTSTEANAARRETPCHSTSPRHLAACWMSSRKQLTQHLSGCKYGFSTIHWSLLACLLAPNQRSSWSCLDWLATSHSTCSAIQAYSPSNSPGVCCTCGSGLVAIWTNTAWWATAFSHCDIWCDLWDVDATGWRCSSLFDRLHGLYFALSLSRIYLCHGKQAGFSTSI